MPKKSYKINDASSIGSSEPNLSNGGGSTANIINQSTSSVNGPNANGTGEAAATTESTEPKRGNWGSQVEFTLACIGYAVGLGNVWRFPHLVFRNGGGAFLIPFVLMVLVIALPIFFSELYVGQYSGIGPNKAYARLAPFFQGLGYCTLLVITYVTIYYMVIIAWIVFYFVASFYPELGWGSCTNHFNTDACYLATQDKDCRMGNENTAQDEIFFNRQCRTVNDICLEATGGQMSGLNASFCQQISDFSPVPINQVITRILASEEYFNENVLGLDGATWEDWGFPRWQLVLCLAFSWIIAFFCVIKGIQSAGKVVYFTALFPYVILTALLIRGVTLEGAAEGVLFYIQPDWDRLTSPGVWADAASQVFYSFGIACSSLVTFASYNNFRNNCHTDAIVVTVANVLTAIFAGFAIFSILGFMAQNLNLPISEVVQEGPGLAFIAYPEAVLLMPLPQLWAVLFFFMMFILGMGSQFGGIEAINTAVIDYWPHLRRHKWRVTAGTCISCFILALPMLCRGGVYMFTLMEWHTASWAILLLGFAEIVVISWVYGIDKALHNLTEMGIRLHKSVRGYWWLVWTVLTPVASLAIFIYTLTDITPTEYNGYVFPEWADALGWLMGASTLAPFFIGAAYRYFKDKPTLREFFTTSHKWKPQEVVITNSDDEASLGDETPNSTANSIADMLNTKTV